MTIEHSPEHRPSVEGPNDRPRPHEFDTSEVVYVGEAPDVSEPDLMKREAARMQRERGERTTYNPERVESARSRRLMKAIDSDFFWHGQITDSDYRDRQNGIRPPFEP